MKNAIPPLIAATAPIAAISVSLELELEVGELDNDNELVDIDDADPVVVNEVV